MFFVITLISCKNKFDKAGWNYSGPDTGDLKEYPYRDRMVDDLLENYTIKGLSKKQVFDLLGETEVVDNTIYYIIFIDFGYDIDPVHTKHLEIKFNEKGIAESAKIDEWEK